MSPAAVSNERRQQHCMNRITLTNRVDITETLDLEVFIHLDSTDLVYHLLEALTVLQVLRRRCDTNAHHNNICLEGNALSAVRRYDDSTGNRGIRVRSDDLLDLRLRVKFDALRFMELWCPCE